MDSMWRQATWWPLRYSLAPSAEFQRVGGQHKSKHAPLQVLDRARLREDNMMQQIKREIAILRDLHHPNVVDLKEVMGSRDKIYMVLEYALVIACAPGKGPPLPLVLFGYEQW